MTTLEKLEGLKGYYAGLKPALADEYVEALEEAIDAMKQMDSILGSCSLYNAKLFGQRLQKVLDNSGMSDRKLAEITGLTATTIARYTRGLTDPKISVVAAIANATGTPIGYFMGAPEE